MPTESLPEVAGGFARFMLCLLIVWSAMQLGGGLYESRVVIPLWSADPTPETLSQRLAASGHTAASTRFWPYISPVVFVLAIINAVIAWRMDGPARAWWLTASLVLIAESVATYGYFVPTILSMMRKSHAFNADELLRTVSIWTSLSSLRLLFAVPALLAGLKALTLLGGRAGWRL